MFSLKEESFDFKGWHFEFFENSVEMYSIIVVGRKDDKVMNWNLTFLPPTFSYDRLYVNKYIEKEQKEKIATFKKYILNEVWE